MRAYRCSPSGCERLLVGSSKRIARAPPPTAAAIWTTCCSATVRSPTSRRTSIWVSIPANNSVARRSMSGRETNKPRRGRSPRQRFSATERFSQNDSSWWTMPMPARSASRGFSKWTGRPSTKISPASGAWMPASILPSVLLPAPFSPHSAWQEPRAMSKPTSCRARAPGKLLPILRKPMSGEDGSNIDESSDKVGRLLQLQIFLGDVGEAPQAQLAGPGPERVDGDAHRIHGDDFGHVPFVEQLVDDLRDADVSPKIRRLREQHRRQSLFDVGKLGRQGIHRDDLDLVGVETGEEGLREERPATGHQGLGDG